MSSSYGGDTLPNPPARQPQTTYDNSDEQQRQQANFGGDDSTGMKMIGEDGDNRNNSGRTNDDTGTTEDSPQIPSADDDIPEQKHAGHLDGPGPEFQKGEGFGGKIQGIKEQIKGKITRNPDLVQQGKDRQTGELKRKQDDEADQNDNPFKNAQGGGDDPEDKPQKPSSSDSLHPNAGYGANSSDASPGTPAGIAGSEDHAGAESQPGSAGTGDENFMEGEGNTDISERGMN